MDWEKASDNSIFVSKVISRKDPITHINTRLVIHDHYVDGKFVGSQAFEDPNKNHSVPDIISILESKGFIEIKLGGCQTDDLPRENSEMYSIRCKKPKQ